MKVRCVGAVTACLSLAILTGCATTSRASSALTDLPVPSPTIQGPILPSSGISFLGSTLFAPSQVGYEQSEFFLSGKATSYTSAIPLAKNGKWDVTPASTAP